VGLTSPAELPFRVDGADDAPPLVLSNSLGSTTEMWDPQVPALSERFRVIRYEHRGHGDAPVPPEPYELADLGGDVLALLDRLGIERAHFAGLSLGGMVGMWLAINAPERIERLVLLCTSPMLAKEHDWPLRGRTAREQGTGAVAEAVVARWFTPDYAAANPRVVAGMRAMVTATPPVGYAGCCGVIERMDLVPELGRIRASTLVIAGTNDPATPPAHAERIVAGVPDSRMELVHAAHLANYERPAEVTRLILSHLEAT
jgi:3-oxoadipate enol-lactonase